MAFAKAGKIEQRAEMSEFESDTFKARMQEPQVFEGSTLCFGLNGSSFAVGNQSGASAGLEEENHEVEEFVRQTYAPSPRGLTFFHYDPREVRIQVEEHFSKSLLASGFYGLPSDKEMSVNSGKLPNMRTTLDWFSVALLVLFVEMV